MSTISSQEIISIIKGEIADFDAHAGEIRETGTVIWVGDGIAIVYGIDHAMYGGNRDIRVRRKRHGTGYPEK